MFTRFGNLFSTLYFVGTLLPLFGTIASVLLLFFCKGKVNKKLWIALNVLGIIGFLALTAMDLLSKPNLFYNPLSALGKTLLGFICLLPMLLFPLISTLGRKGGWKPLMLIPAFVLLLLLMFPQGQFIRVLVPNLLLPFPLLILAAIWYYTGKKTWLGIILSIYGVFCIVLLPLFCTGTGYMILYGARRFVELDSILKLYKMLITQSAVGPMTWMNCIAIPGIPLAIYAAIGQLVVAGVHSSRLPNEKGRVSATAQPVPVKASAPEAILVPEAEKSVPETQPEPNVQPAPAARFCIHCGSALNEGDKFCTRCGNAVYPN